MPFKKKPYQRIPRIAIFLVSTVLVWQVQASELPLWEVGAGAAVLSMPDYRGADERRTYALPLPYLVYRGEFLQVDRDKVRGLFYKGERSEWDVSMGAAVPVRSDSNRARVGMPDLDPTFEIGPQWSYRLRQDQRQSVSLRLPLRKVFAVSLPNLRDVGTVFTPTIAVDRANHPWPGWQASVSTGPVFGDHRYFQYYYGVSATEAIPSRPSWNASPGYGGWQLTATLSKRFGDAWVGGFLRADHLGGAAFESSPLVREKTSWMAGVGMAWVFAKSERMVLSNP
jgi:outer membrane scaffolding protein for murein synthesis (MipA/OmpV family)